jgi:hypothetical protein
LQGTAGHIGGWLSGTLRGAVSAAVAAGLVLPAGSPVYAAERVVPVIDGFGPYKIGMTLDQAKAADRGGKPGPCGAIAESRQCLVLKAEVFQEPAVLYAVLDPAAARVERVVARLDPQLTRRRAYRCVRLTEKVFALLVVVYGPRYKQRYDRNRKPLPAVAWDGEESGRLIFEAKCRTHDEGNPLIRVVERYPDGKKPPQVAAKKAAPQASAQASAQAGVDLPPAPPKVPVGVVEQAPLEAPAITTNTDTDDRMARLARELEHATGKEQEQPPRRDLPPSSEDRRAPAVESGPKTVRTAALTTTDVRPPDYSEAYEPPEPTDLEAPEPFAMPEEEEMFRRQRDGAPTVVATAPAAQGEAAKAVRIEAPDFTEPASPADADAETAPATTARVQGWTNAENSGFSPVMTGGWRHRAPVPPARPWREYGLAGSGSGA